MRLRIISIIKSNSFLLGILMAFDITGKIGSNKMDDELKESESRINSILNSVHPVSKRTDEENLRSDLENIGEDIRFAMRSIHE